MTRTDTGMSIHVGFAPRRNFLRSSTAAALHARSTSVGPLLIASTARQLRAQVDDALARGDRRLAVRLEAWQASDVAMLGALVHCARRCGQHGAILDILDASGGLRECARDLGLDAKLHFA